MAPLTVCDVIAHLHAACLLHKKTIAFFALRELVHLVVFPRRRLDIPAL